MNSASSDISGLSSSSEPSSHSDEHEEHETGGLTTPVPGPVPPLPVLRESEGAGILFLFGFVLVLVVLVGADALSKHISRRQETIAAVLPPPLRGMRLTADDWTLDLPGGRSDWWWTSDLYYKQPRHVGWSYGQFVRREQDTLVYATTSWWYAACNADSTVPRATTLVRLRCGPVAALKTVEASPMRACTWEAIVEAPEFCDAASHRACDKLLQTLGSKIVNDTVYQLGFQHYTLDQRVADAPGMFISCGSYAACAVTSAGPVLAYAEGDVCPNGQKRRSLVHVKCGPLLKITSVMERTACVYDVTLETPAVCAPLPDAVEVLKTCPPSHPVPLRVTSEHKLKCGLAPPRPSASVPLPCAKAELKPATDAAGQQTGWTVVCLE